MRSLSFGVPLIMIEHTLGLVEYALYLFVAVLAVLLVLAFVYAAVRLGSAAWYKSKREFADREE